MKKHNQTNETISPSTPYKFHNQNKSIFSDLS